MGWAPTHSLPSAADPGALLCCPSFERGVSHGSTRGESEATVPIARRGSGAATEAIPVSVHTGTEIVAGAVIVGVDAEATAGVRAHLAAGETAIGAVTTTTETTIARTDAVVAAAAAGVTAHRGVAKEVVVAVTTMTNGTVAVGPGADPTHPGARTAGHRLTRGRNPRTAGVAVASLRRHHHRRPLSAPGPRQRARRRRKRRRRRSPRSPTRTG